MKSYLAINTYSTWSRNGHNTGKQGTGELFLTRRLYEKKLRTVVCSTMFITLCRLTICCFMRTTSEKATWRVSCAKVRTSPDVDPSLAYLSASQCKLTIPQTFVQNKAILRFFRPPFQYVKLWYARQELRITSVYADIRYQNSQTYSNCIEPSCQWCHT